MALLSPIFALIWPAKIVAHYTHAYPIGVPFSYFSHLRVSENLPLLLLNKNILFEGIVGQYFGCKRKTYEVTKHAILDRTSELLHFAVNFAISELSL